MERRGIIFSNNYILAEGIRSLINKELQDISIEISDIIAYKDNKTCSVLVVDNAVLADPASYSLERIHKCYKKAKLILLSKSIPAEQLQPYFDTFIVLSEPVEIIKEKVRGVVKLLKQKNIQSSSDSLLSERENEVLRYVALGYINRDISDTLSISTHTVITHRKNITAKLGIKTIAGLAVYAVINGIISTEEMKS